MTLEIVGAIILAVTVVGFVGYIGASLWAQCSSARCAD